MIPIFSSCFFSLYVTLIFHVFPYVFGESSLLLSSSWLYMFNSNQTTTAKDELCFIGLSRYIFPLWRFCFHLAIILLCNVIICSFFSLQNVHVFFVVLTSVHSSIMWMRWLLLSTLRVRFFSSLTHNNNRLHHTLFVYLFLKMSSSGCNKQRGKMRNKALHFDGIFIIFISLQHRGK